MLQQHLLSTLFYIYRRLQASSLKLYLQVLQIFGSTRPLRSLLHSGVGQLLSVDDQVGVVRGLECKPSVTDAAAVASLLVLLHDVLQIFFSFGK